MLEKGGVSIATPMLGSKVLMVALLVAAGLAAGLYRARRWRLAALTGALFFLASQANAAWGPFRLLLEVAVKV